MRTVNLSFYLLLLTLSFNPEGNPRKKCRVGYDIYDCPIVQEGLACNAISRKCTCENVRCRMLCVKGWRYGKDGCPLCDCAHKSVRKEKVKGCPGLRCGLVCAHGYMKDSKGCDVCICARPTTTKKPFRPNAELEELKECLKRKWYHKFSDWFRNRERRKRCETLLAKYNSRE